jgi:hypothetical protein
MKSIMRLVVKILNCAIAALALAATICLFATPSLSFNSRIDLDVAKLSEFIPDTEYTHDIDVPKLIGTNTVSVALKFKVMPGDVTKIKTGDQDKMNELFIDENVRDVVNELHTPVELMTDQTIRSVLRRVVKEQITNYVDKAVQDYKDKHGGEGASTEDVMDSIGYNDNHFKKFAGSIYDVANSENPTFTALNDVLFEQIDDTLAKAEKVGAKVDTESFSEEKRVELKNSIKNVIEPLNLIKEDGEHLVQISLLPYAYLTKFVKDQLSKKGVSEEVLAQKSNEDMRSYSDRLLGEFVRDNMPEVFYTGVGYAGLGLYIGLIVLTIAWVGLAVVILLKTFVTKTKLLNIFYPFFFILGIFQLVLGFGITYAAKVVLPSKFDISTLNLPVSKVLMAPRTYALAPSIIFIVVIGLLIVSFILGKIFKAEPKKEAE